MSKKSRRELANLLFAFFLQEVFFNGVRVKNVSYRDNLVTFQVPYITEDIDDILVTYSY